MISVVVPARNAEELIRPLLDALEAQTLPRDRWELVVADDASGDGTASVVRESGLGSVVRMPRQGGSYAARNLALRETSGALIALTDADCRPEPAWLEMASREVEARGLDLLAGGIHIPASDSPGVAESLDVAAGLDQERYVSELGFGATANLIMRRCVIDRIGPFNERLISGGDVEFSRRATAAGFKLGYSGDVRVRHEPRTRARQLVRQSFRIGFGLGQWAHFAAGAARGGETSRLWTSWAAWRPRRTVPGIERLVPPPSPRRHLGLAIAHYTWVQLPRNFGNLAATLRAGRGT